MPRYKVQLEALYYIWEDNDNKDKFTLHELSSSIALDGDGVEEISGKVSHALANAMIGLLPDAVRTKVQPHMKIVDGKDEVEYRLDEGDNA